MRANMLNVVSQAISESRAVPAFSVYDFTTAQAVVRGSEEDGKPVILLLPPKAAEGNQGNQFIQALRQLADDSTTPVILQLDHAATLRSIESAVAAGVDAVLADGSALPAVDNAAFAAQARELIGNGIVLEAELGALAGNEDVSEGRAAGSKTNPAEIADFLRTSGADLLAVAVGNVHGNYRGVPELDWPLIAQIKHHAGSTPLVLHGASGLSNADLAAAGHAGIGKVNFNTELRTTIFDYIQEAAGAHAADGMNMLAFQTGWRSRVVEFTVHTHRRLAASG